MAAEANHQSEPSLHRECHEGTSLNHSISPTPHRSSLSKIAAYTLAILASACGTTELSGSASGAEEGKRNPPAKVLRVEDTPPAVQVRLEEKEEVAPPRTVPVPEIVLSHGRELAIEIIRELDKFHHRRFHNFPDVAPKLTEHERVILKLTLPTLIEQTGQDLRWFFRPAEVEEVSAATSDSIETSAVKTTERSTEYDESQGPIDTYSGYLRVLAWFRLYRLEQQLDCPTPDSHRTMAAEIFKEVRANFEGELLKAEAAAHRDSEKFDQFFKQVNIYAKCLYGLYELLDEPARQAILESFGSLERRVHAFSPEVIGRYLGQHIQDTLVDSEEFDQLSTKDIERFTTEETVSRRGQALRQIAHLVGLDANFKVSEKGEEGARPYFYECKVGDEQTRWRVEIQVPKHDDSTPTFILRDVECADRFITIACSELMSMQAFPRGGIFARSNIADHVRDAMRNYASENNPQAIAHVKKFELKDYDRVVMLRVFPESHDLAAAGSLGDQFLMSKAFETLCGAEKVVQAPILVTKSPQAAIRSQIERYKKLFPGEKVLFDIYLSCHGNSQYFWLDSPLQARELAELARELDINICVRSLACHQGGIIDGFQRFIDEHPEMREQLQAFPSCSPAGFGFLSMSSKEGPVHWVINPLRASLYDILVIEQLFKGKEFGEAHWNADRAAKKVKGAKTDAQGFFDGELIGKASSDSARSELKPLGGDTALAC